MFLYKSNHDIIGGGLLVLWYSLRLQGASTTGRLPNDVIDNYDDVVHRFRIFSAINTSNSHYSPAYLICVDRRNEEEKNLVSGCLERIFATVNCNSVSWLTVFTRFSATRSSALSVWKILMDESKKETEKHWWYAKYTTPMNITDANGGLTKYQPISIIPLQNSVRQDYTTWQIRA